MGMTLSQKILADKAGLNRVEAGQLITAKLDLVLGNDITSPVAIKELEKAGIYVIARPGPYICSEWNGGSLPARILESGMPIRCADPSFIAEVKKWYAAILSRIAPFRYTGGVAILSFCNSKTSWTSSIARIRMRTYPNLLS